VVLVHGANNPAVLRLGRKKIYYFGRTEAYLRKLGLRLLVPVVNPFGSIEERALDLERQILEAIPEGKFNIVAHSMGGLDARYLASRRPIGARITSITTVATPHHGAWYADFAEKWVFRRQGLNKLANLFGMRMDQMPALRVRHVEGEFNAQTPDNPNVAYYSYGTATSMWKSPPFFWGMNFITKIMEKRAVRQIGVGAPMPVGVRSGKAEVRISQGTADTVVETASMPPATWVVKKWAGRNDGVVSLSSSVWGTYLGTIKSHHWGPMGLLTRMKEHKFWEQVIRKMIELGF
jgi:pimeloyl-ACP methyl ester carboxylesterase